MLSRMVFKQSTLQNCGATKSSIEQATSDGSRKTLIARTDYTESTRATSSHIRYARGSKHTTQAIHVNPYMVDVSQAIMCQCIRVKRINKATLTNNITSNS